MSLAVIHLCFSLDLPFGSLGCEAVPVISFVFSHRKPPKKVFGDDKTEHTGETELN